MGRPDLSARIGIGAALSWWTPTARCSAKRRTLRRASKLLFSRVGPGHRKRAAPGRRALRVEEKGAHELKGVTQPFSLYRVVRASGGGRRGGVRALTQFVVREEDIGTLLRRWDRVRAGEGRFLQIVGEPGLGKSRLVRSSTPGSVRRRTPGSNGTRPSFCRIRPCIQLPSGAGFASAVGRCRRKTAGRPRDDARPGKARHPGNVRRFSRRCSIFRCLRTAPRNSAPKNCVGGDLPRWSPYFWPGPDPACSARLRGSAFG